MTASRRHWFAGIVAMFVAAVIGGCHAPPATPGSVDPTGEYTLISVDGLPVPATVSHDGANLKVLSGMFTIVGDGTCSTTTIFVAPSGQEVTRTVEATYRMSGARLTMRWKGAGSTVGTIDGDTFTMNNEGMLFEYER